MDIPSRRSGPGEFVHAGFAVLRTPALPFSVLTGWSSGLEAPGCEGAALEAAVGRDQAHLREGLRALLSRPDVREALFVASPDLEASLPEWEKDPTSERGAKVERTLLRYLGRMTARSTPFGLFAGYTVAAIGPASHLELAPHAQYQRRTRLDMDLVCELSPCWSGSRGCGAGSPGGPTPASTAREAGCGTCTSSCPSNGAPTPW